MAFMQPEISRCDWYEIDTSDGTVWLPVDVAGKPVRLSDGECYTDGDAEWPALRRALRCYTDGDLYSVTVRRGWYGARLSAPGYLDCTGWCAFRSLREARAYLRDDEHACPDCGGDTDCAPGEYGACDCEVSE